MKFLKPALIILSLLALTFTVRGSKISFNKEVNQSIKLEQKGTSEALPIHGDLLFAFTAIASLGGYIVFKKL
ncbi:MAG: hypothetical protein EOP00_31370 [Pedobacter sp.]|nr:MAG: hypothetical protein EOP00_31370 [Pedobacter sp.]